ncbi:hypothetical protein A3709_18875 [Halioglobus sp. HI00S01]|uniref:metalloprotease family protein n=1 Tax=Halioglobus sp. HI00S01 TaxID=1822214 RepID=UPI0007C38262|nr:metalloprotease family protein [Halioglobus sp. HI00S01]KZX57689.1 hypothetical protein A3709_18875 [Halioglobus sp. HI00S01]
MTKHLKVLAVMWALYLMAIQITAYYQLMNGGEIIGPRFEFWLRMLAINLACLLVALFVFKEKIPWPDRLVAFPDSSPPDNSWVELPAYSKGVLISLQGGSSLFIFWLLYGFSYSMGFAPSVTHCIWIGFAWATVFSMVHEYAHKAALPGSIRRTAEIGLNLTYFGWYLMFDGPISRARYVWLLLLPFITLSIIPMVMAILLPDIASPLAAISIGHGLLCGGDLLGLIRLLSRSSSEHLLYQSGAKTFIKEGSL